MPARTQFSMKKCLLTRQKPLNWAEAAEFPAGLTQQSLPRPEPSMRTKHAWRTAPHATQKQDSVQNAKTVTGWKADLVTYAAIFLENCAVCDASGSTCTKCFDGYKLTGGSCTGGSCEDGYWWDDWELACFACPADCKTCSDDATCESCFDGYYHDMDRCVPCSQNCKQCNYNGCTQCESGYELNNGKCSQASPNCLSCSGNTCLQCGTNSELYNGACCAIGGTCKTWENSDECLCAECYPLYELTSEKLCVKCTKETPENCAEASIYCGKCYTCKDGYSLTAEGQCVKTTMPEHCKTYDGTKCTQCDTGYGLDSNNKCEKYPDLGCETYQWTADGFECASCSGTQKLAYNICKDGLRVCVEDYDDVCFTQEYK